MTNINKAMYISGDMALAEIEKVTKEAAEVVKQCFDTVTIDTYVHFLDVMYHYTANTGEKAAEAAKNVSNSELKQFFIEFEKEEHWHYRLAVHDLKAFGKIPSEKKPSVVLAFDDFWSSLADKHHNGYLGALYVFENIAKYLEDDIIGLIERVGLSKKETAWISTHAEEDIEHGKIVDSMLRKYVEDNPLVAVSSARQAAKLWENIMIYAFSILSPRAAA